MKPYFGLRSYTDGGEHYSGQIGSEATPQEWLAALVECTAEWVRVLKPSGSLFVNLGDKYAGGDGRNNNGTGTSTLGHHQGGGGPHSEKLSAASPKRARVPGQPKLLLGLPWRYAIAAIDQLGLILRRDIIWSKPNGLPESVTDRCRSSHEYVFHLVKQPRYYAAVDEIREPHAAWTLKAYEYEQRARARNGGYNRRKNPNRVDEGDAGDYAVANPLGKLPGSVWDIPSQPLTVPARLGIDHFAAFPMELPRRIILGWSPRGVCTACGEGRRPVAHRDFLVQPDVSRERNGDHGRLDASNGWGSVPRGSSRATITGYACACTAPTAPTRPAVVLDPFGGTGTTALVAAMHGRTGITVDMSADYSRLAAWRTTDPAQRAAAMGVPKPPPIPDGMEPLFT